MSRRQHLRILPAMAIGYAPGFLLPFAVAATLDDRFSDPLLLAIATSITVGSVLSMAIENAWAARIAAAAAAGMRSPRSQLRAGARQAVGLGGAVTGVLLPAFSVAYLVGDRLDISVLVVCLASVVAFPTAAGLAAVPTGFLNAHGRVATNLLLQGLRGAFPLVGLVLALATSWLWTVGLLLTIGEILRGLIGYRLAAKYCVDDGGTFEMPSTKSLMHHVAGLSISGSSPIIDRAFLAAAPSGSLTRFEMADRVFFAGSQIANNLLILTRIARVSTAVVTHGFRRAVAREAARVALGSTLLAAVLAGGLVAVLPLVPSELRDAVPWCIALLVSLPAASVGAFATRMTVASGRSAVIPWLAVGGTALNLLGNVIGYQLFGAFGIVASTIFCRFVLTALNLAVLVRPRDDERA